jgi:hypothetical protein
VCKIECGVPQGSILGPLLYLIYVNDISQSTEANILSFADDTSLYLSHPDINTLFEKANLEINNLYDWFCANRLSLNAKKTKFIVINGLSKKCDFTDKTVSINETHLTQIGNDFDEQSTKFLGIHIDESLSWKYHLKHINNRISKASFMIRQAKHFLPCSSLRTLYFAMIHPFLTYGILAWGNANPSFQKRTIILQKRAIRTINKASYNSHTEPLFKQSNIMIINDQYDYEVALFMHDYMTNNLPTSFQNTYMCNYEVHESNQTRRSNQLYIKRCD